MQTSGVLQHPLSLSSIILLRFLKTHFKFTALYLPLACSKLSLGLWGGLGRLLWHPRWVSKKAAHCSIYGASRGKTQSQQLSHIYCIEHRRPWFENAFSRWVLTCQNKMYERKLVVLLKKGGARDLPSVWACLPASLFLPMGDNVLYCGWCPAVLGPLRYVGPPAGWT